MGFWGIAGIVVAALILLYVVIWIVRYALPALNCWFNIVLTCLSTFLRET